MANEGTDDYQQPAAAVNHHDHNNNDNDNNNNYYDIIIENEPILTEKGFTKFSLPTTNNGNANQMILYNDKDAELITYIKFNKYNNIDAALELLTDKLLAESKISLEVLDVIRRYFRNACFLLANGIVVIITVKQAVIGSICKTRLVRAVVDR